MKKYRVSVSSYVIVEADSAEEASKKFGTNYQYDLEANMEITGIEEYEEDFSEAPNNVK